MYSVSKKEKKKKKKGSINPGNSNKNQDSLYALVAAYMLCVYADARSLIKSFSQSNDCGLKYVTTLNWFFANAHPT